jgi:peptidoglycan/xylan/chitin deacetylase (PgdA/CDA1 family)
MKKLFNLLAAAAIVAGLIVPIAGAFAVSPNLIANPSAESTIAGAPDGWLQGHWGANTPTFSYTSTGAEDGNHALSLTVSGYTDGDAKWYFAPVAVSAGTQYTFSDYYQSTVPTNVIVQTDDGAGNYTYTDLASLPASATWQQVSASFTAPIGAQNATVFHVIASNGTLSTDNFTLAASSTTPVVTPSPTPVTPSPTPTPVSSSVANPSLETPDALNSATPANWQNNAWGTNTSNFSYLSTGHTGNRSVGVQTTSYTSGDAKWFFTPVAVKAGTQYIFSDYYQSTISSEVDAAFTMADGSTQYLYMGAPAASSAWKQFSATFTAPSGATAVSVYHLIAGVGTLTTDDFAMPEVAPVIPTSNLVANPSTENPDPANANAPASWQNNAWGTNTSTFSYLSTGAHNGSRAVQVQTTQYTDGDAKWFFNPVAVTPDTQYHFIDYYKSTTATEIDVAFGMSDGTTTYQILGLPEPAAGWTNFATNFSVPLGAQTMTVYHLIHNVGTLTLDDASLQSYIPSGFNRGLVSLTFDDGYDNEYTQGLPLLKKYGFTSTQYIITNVLNTAGYLTNAQVKALYAGGNEISSHTLTHNNLLTETPAQYTNELSQSKTVLQQLIGAPVTDLAFPNGLYNQGIINTTKNYYAASRGVEDGLNSKDNFNMYDIKVQNVYNTTTTAQIADWVKQAESTKTWLVLVYHAVNPSTSAGIYSVTPAQLDAQLSAIKSSGAPVLTLKKALAEITPQLGK